MARESLPHRQDMAERKRLDEEQEQVLAVYEHLVLAILREKELADAILASVADALIAYDPACKIVRMNAAAERMLGYSATQREWSIAERAALVRAETPDGRPYPVDELPPARAMRGETVQGAVMVLHPPTGRTVWVSASAAPIRTADGETLGAVVTYADITPLRELEEQREEFIRMISHDLRNPLLVVGGHADLLRRALVNRGMEREVLSAEAIRTSARQMDSMIRELVESARLESGRLALRTEQTDLRQLLFDLIERVGTVEDRGRLHAECPEAIPPVAADRKRLERAIVNLVVNALEYSPPDSRVIVGACARQGEVIVSVADQGVGIPADELPHVFARYYRARTGGDTEGLGLGLYISRLIVEAHGGRIWAESEVGKGTTFSFSLPMAGG